MFLPHRSAPRFRAPAPLGFALLRPYLDRGEWAHRQNGLILTKAACASLALARTVSRRASSRPVSNPAARRVSSGRRLLCPRRLAMAVILSSCTAMSLRSPKQSCTRSSAERNFARRRDAFCRGRLGEELRGVTHLFRLDAELVAASRIEPGELLALLADLAEAPCQLLGGGGLDRDVAAIAHEIVLRPRPLPRLRAKRRSRASGHETAASVPRPGRARAPPRVAA